MRYFVSDIHGEYDLFIKLIQKIKLSQNDEMYILGDIIDKGKNSIALAKLIASMPNLHCIIGNHEYSFLKYYHSLIEGENVDFDSVLSQLKEYFQGDGHLLDWELVDWLDALPSYIEGEDFICVHAGLPVDSLGETPPLDKVSIEQLVHDRRFKDPTLIHKNPKCIFFGHTQTNCICGENKILGYRRKGRTPNGTLSDYYKIHLDTGAWSNGVLGCFCADTCKAIYVKKENGATGA